MKRNFKRMRRPTTSYSLQRLGFTQSKQPHTTLERRKFENQTVVYPVSPRRQELLKLTDIKTKKEILVWIESERPNGMEILSKIANNTKSKYRNLIKRALQDLVIVEERANKITETELDEKKKNAKMIKKELKQYKERLSSLQLENHLLQHKIDVNNSKLKSINDDYKKLQELMKGVKSKIVTDIDDSTEINKQTVSDIVNRRFIDDRTLPNEKRVEMYIEEGERLDKLLIKLEEKMMALNREQIALHSGKLKSNGHPV